MKVSSLPRALLWLSLSLVLAACGKPQPPTTTNSSSTAEGSSSSSNQSGQRAIKPGDERMDEAGRMLAEAIKRREASAASQQSPAGAIANATPAQTLGERLGAAGRPFTSFGGHFSVTPPPGFGSFSEKVEHDTLPGGFLQEEHTFQSGPSGSDPIIVLAYSYVPGASDLAQQSLESMRDGLRRTDNGTLEKQESMTVQGQPALSFYYMKTVDGKQRYVRAFAVVHTKQSRCYLFAYDSSDRARLDTPEAESFFKSFNLLD